MQEHDGIGAALAHIATGAEGLLILFGQALAGIGSHQQPIGAGGIGHLLIREGIHAGQARIGPQREDEAADHDEEDKDADAPKEPLDRIGLFPAAMRFRVAAGRLLRLLWLVALLQLLRRLRLRSLWRPLLWLLWPLWWLLRGTLLGPVLAGVAGRGFLARDVLLRLGTIRARPAADGPTVAVLEGTAIGPKDELTG